MLLLPKRLLCMLAATFLMTQPICAGADSLRLLFGTPGELGAPVSSPGDDLWNMVTPDGLQMYFTSKRDGGKWNLYTAQRASATEPFSAAELLSNVNASGWNTTYPTVSADGLELFFDSDRPTPNDENLQRRYHVWTATRPNQQVDFGEPRYVQELDGVGVEVGAPCLSTDGLTLYYNTGFENGAYSIFEAKRATRTDTWQFASDIGKLVNLTNATLSPGARISADNLNLFFAAENLTHNRGGYDMYVSTRRSPSEPWGAPINLGDTVNGTWSNDLENASPFLDQEQSVLYFTHHPTNGSYSVYDLWQVPLVPFESRALSAQSAFYSQSFDSLGIDATDPQITLPAGWTFTANDVVFSNTTSRAFPSTTKVYTGAFNAGTGVDPDRALATDVTRTEAGELDFRAFVSDSSLQALRLGFDIEAWQLRSGLGTNPGEAGFHVVLEADSGHGFQTVADLGEFSTGKTLVRPATGTLVDGNDPAYRHSFDTGAIDVTDVPAGSTLRVRWIGTTGSRNVVFGLDNVSLRFAGAGDSNIDGLFNSEDLVNVFQAGEYEDGLAHNSTWSEGDWTGDGEFDTTDLVVAFQRGTYEQPAAVAAVPEPAGGVLLIMSSIFGLALRRRRRSVGFRSANSCCLFLSNPFAERKAT